MRRKRRRSVRRRGRSGQVLGLGRLNRRRRLGFGQHVVVFRVGRVGRLRGLVRFAVPVRIVADQNRVVGVDHTCTVPGADSVSNLV